MSEELIEAVVEHLSELFNAVDVEAATLSSLKTVDPAVLEAIDFESMSQEQIVAVLPELGIDPGQLDPKFGMTSSQATAVDVSGFIEARDGTLFPTRSDSIMGTNGYERID